MEGGSYSIWSEVFRSPNVFFVFVLIQLPLIKNILKVTSHGLVHFKIPRLTEDMAPFLLELTIYKSYY